MKDVDYLKRELSAKAMAIRVEQAISHRFRFLGIDRTTITESPLMAIAERQAELGIRPKERRG